MNATHKANQAARRLRSLKARIVTKEKEHACLLKHFNINLDDKHRIENELKTLRNQLAKLL